MRPVITLLCVAALATSANAQLRGSLTGVIEKAPANPCNAQATHRVKCTNVLLYSSTLALDPLEGRMVQLEGNLDLGVGCNAIDVDMAATTTRATNALAIFGFRPNRPIVFTTVAPLGSFVAYAFGCGPGFLPLGPLGSVLIKPDGAIYWGADISIGVAVRTVTIPNDPGLIGTTFYMQTASLSIAPLGGGLLNPTCFRIVQ